MGPHLSRVRSRGGTTAGISEVIGIPEKKAWSGCPFLGHDVETPPRALRVHRCVPINYRTLRAPLPANRPLRGIGFRSCLRKTGSESYPTADFHPSCNSS